MSHHKQALWVTLENWLPLAVVIIIFSGLIYVAVQQNYRTNANDPQIQISEDIATAVAQGSATPDNIVPPTPTTDIAASLSPFVVVFNATGTPIGSSVALNGKLPTLPSGVFDSVKLRGEDDFTWQPQPGVRVAAVLNRFTGSTPGYVLAGRSLKEVEIRINKLTIMTAVATALALVLSFLVIYLLVMYGSKRHHRHHEAAAEQADTTISPE